jgi:hypothetical protein
VELVLGSSEGAELVTWISEKDTATDRIFTNEVVKLDIRGKRLFSAPPGRYDLSLYANVDLPKPGTPERQALARGGWRAWFQQQDAHEADHRDETGYLGPVAIPEFGDRGLLISHTWPHTVDADDWEFCIEIFAYGPSGVARRVPLTLKTREIKLVSRP